MRCIPSILLILLLSLPKLLLGHQPYAALAIDSSSNKLLHYKAPRDFRYPASLTKLVTLYIVFDELNSGRLKWEQKLKVSHYAASQPASKLYLKTGELISVKDAVLALIVKSANDVAVVLAEGVGGSETKFVAQMNKTCARLGMSRSHFCNASGLHNASQYTSAYDMARLATALARDFPKFYSLFRIKKFTYKGRDFYSTNKLIGNYDGLEGLKTGYTEAAGFNLVTSLRSAKGNRIIGVVMGANSSIERDRKMKELLNHAVCELQGVSSKLQSQLKAKDVPSIVRANNTGASVIKVASRRPEKRGATVIPVNTKTSTTKTNYSLATRAPRLKPSITKDPPVPYLKLISIEK